MRYATHDEAVAAQIEAQRTSDHALIWFQPMCEAATHAERERTGHFGRGITKRFDADTIRCADCQTVIRNGGSRPHDLLTEIKASMLRRNPSLADPEWTIESAR